MRLMQRTPSKRPLAQATLDRLAQLGVVVSATLSLAGWLALHWRGEPMWATELLRYLPWPTYIGPALATGALALWRLGWRWRGVAVATLLLLAGPVLGLATGHGQSGRIALRVMTYNIKSVQAVLRPDGYAALAREIAQQAPDLLLMQDAQALNEPVPATRPADLPPELAALLAGWSLCAADQFVIASRHPLQGCRMQPWPAGPADESGRARAPHDNLPGGVLRCMLSVAGVAGVAGVVSVADEAGAEVEVMTTHLMSPRDGLNAARRLGWQALPDEVAHAVHAVHTPHPHAPSGLAAWRANFATRLAQSRALAALLRERRVQHGATGAPARPLILGGDLNAVEASPVVQGLLDTGLRDAWSSASLGWGLTHGHSLRPHISLLRIDHLLVSDAIAVQATRVGGSDGSEHRPVISDLWLVGASAAASAHSPPR